MVVMREAARYEPGRSRVTAWLCGIARNCARQRLDRDRPFQPLDEEDDACRDAALQPDPLGDLTRAEGIERVRKAVLNLPIRYREVVVLVRSSGDELRGGRRRPGLRRRNGSIASPPRPPAVGDQAVSCRSTACGVPGGNKTGGCGGDAGACETARAEPSKFQELRMTCRECQDLMLEVARDRAAPFVRQTVLAHTEFCSACGTSLDRERALTAGLRAVAFEGASSSPSADLESRLLTGVRVPPRRLWADAVHGCACHPNPAKALAARGGRGRTLRGRVDVVAHAFQGRSCSSTRDRRGTEAGAADPGAGAADPGRRRRASGSDGRRAQRAPGASRIPAGCQTPDSAGWLRSHPIGCRPAGVRERPDRAARNSCDGSSELRRRNTSRQRLGDSGGSARRTGWSASSDSARECKYPGLTPSTVRSGFKQLRAPAMERIGRCERL